MPGRESDGAGSFFVACVREPLDAFEPAPERDEATRGRDDDRVLDAMRPRYPRGATPGGGDTHRQSAGVSASGLVSVPECEAPAAPSPPHDGNRAVSDSIVEGTPTANSGQHSAIASSRLADGANRGSVMFVSVGASRLDHHGHNHRATAVLRVHPAAHHSTHDLAEGMRVTRAVGRGF